MSEDIVICSECSFKCVRSQLYKTGGYCPVCLGRSRQTLVSKQINADTGSVIAADAQTRYNQKYQRQ